MLTIATVFIIVLSLSECLASWRDTSLFLWETMLNA